jgi:arginase
VSKVIVRPALTLSEYAFTEFTPTPVSFGLMPTLTSIPLKQLILVCVTWRDRMSDARLTERTLDSAGNIHGMPLAFLLGIAGKVDEFSWIKPVLQANRLVYIGLRDVDAAEKRILKENNIKAFSMHEVDRYGIGKVVELALDAVNPNRDLPIHLSFDVDALDPSVAPSTGTPVRLELKWSDTQS